MATTGVSYAGTATTLSSSPYSNNDWASPSNATGSPDGLNAAVTVPTFDSSDYSYLLKCYNYGFSIPDSTIDGIIVKIRGYCSAGTATYAHVKLLNASSSTVGDNKGGASMPGSSGDRTFGGSTDDWNSSLTYTDINNSNFGVAISCQATTNNTDVNIDSVSIEVYYTEGGGGGGYANDVFSVGTANISKVFSVATANIDKVFGV